MDDATGVTSQSLESARIGRWRCRGGCLNLTTACSISGVLAKYQGVSLAEIYAAIEHALSNREEIAAEIEEEDRLDQFLLQSAAEIDSIPVGPAGYLPIVFRSWQRCEDGGRPANPFP